MSVIGKMCDVNLPVYSVIVVTLLTKVTAAVYLVTQHKLHKARK